MSRVIAILNRQRKKRVNRARLTQIIHALLDRRKLVEVQLGIVLVGGKEMACVNETFLRHKGSTDVITFDHGDQTTPGHLHGELFICVNDAIAQAKEFKTTWQSEVVRYVVHGVLHLEGYDDLKPTARRKMKRVENQLVRTLAEDFAFARIGGK